MSDAFWMGFFTFLGIIVTGVLAEVRARRLLSQGLQLGKDLHENTVAVITGNTDVSQKLDSAEKNVTKSVIDTGNEVKKEAVNTAKVGAVMALQTAQTAKSASQEILKQMAPMVEKMNGGAGGFNELTQRVASLETTFAKFLETQVDIVKSIDHLATQVQRRQLD